MGFKVTINCMEINILVLFSMTNRFLHIFFGNDSDFPQVIEIGCLLLWVECSWISKNISVMSGKLQNFPKSTSKYPLFCNQQLSQNDILLTLHSKLFTSNKLHKYCSVWQWYKHCILTLFNMWYPIRAPQTRTVC